MFLRPLYLYFPDTSRISKHKKLKFATTYLSEHVIFLETDLKNDICVMFCLSHHIKEWKYYQCFAGGSLTVVLMRTQVLWGTTLCRWSVVPTASWHVWPLKMKALWFFKHYEQLIQWHSVLSQQTYFLCSILSCIWSEIKRLWCRPTLIFNSIFSVL